MSGWAVVDAAGGEKREAPWRAGLRAARANMLPALLVQGVMVAVLVGYFYHPGTREVLERLASVKARWGNLYSILAGVIAGGLMPELLRFVVFQRMHWRRSNALNLLFSIPFWSGMGVVVDWLYRRQVEWWGDEASLSVVVPQVLLDQFVFTPFFSAPVTAILYDWKNSGFHWSRRFVTKDYYLDSIFPTLVAIWGVWIPIVCILYTLPEAVQVPLYSLALTLWVMLYTWMSEERSGKPSPP